MTSGRMSEVEFTVEGSKWKTVRPSRSAICKSLGMDVNMQFRKKNRDGGKNGQYTENTSAI